MAGKNDGFAMRYETQSYLTQRPLSFVNWLPLDPMFHNTEFIENDKVREYDNDLMQIDFTKLTKEFITRRGFMPLITFIPIIRI